MSEVVLSGIRATGRLHIGSLLGAVQHFVRFQKEGNTCLYFVADYHTLTTLKNPDEMRKNLVEIVKDYLAAGLDPERAIIYAQSSVPEIPELCLLLAMVQPYGDLIRIPTFKEMARKYPNDLNFGIVTYPVLMAADILGPKATLVPVGEDQVPNVELARALARRFNDRFGETFVVPKLLENMVKVPGLDGEKMGKSDADNAIDISMSIPDILQRYLRKGVTDPNRLRATDPGDPYKCRSVYPIHEIVTEGERETREIATACMNASITCVKCKERMVLGGLAPILEPFQARRAELADKDDFVHDILHEGGKKARARIAETVAVVRDKMGVVTY